MFQTVCTTSRRPASILASLVVRIGGRQTKSNPESTAAIDLIFKPPLNQLNRTIQFINNSSSSSSSSSTAGGCDHDASAIGRSRCCAAEHSFMPLCYSPPSICGCHSTTTSADTCGTDTIICQVQIHNGGRKRAAAEHRGAVQSQDAGGACAATTWNVRRSDRAVASNDVLGARCPPRPSNLVSHNHNHNRKQAAIAARRPEQHSHGPKGVQLSTSFEQSV